MSILVSIIVPAYNVEKYIEKCVLSLVNQSLESSQYEIICVNDGSTDRTPQILSDLAERFSNIVVVNRENGGLSAARNSGMAVARGTYIGFVDGDDWVDCKMFEELCFALEKNPQSEIAMCGVETIFEYCVPKNISRGYDQYFKIDLEGEYEVRREFYSLNKPCWNKLYRKSLLDNNGIIFPEGMNNEDEVFHNFVFSRATHITFLKKRWYKYMRYGEGIIAEQERLYKEKQELPDYFMKVWPLLIEYVKRDCCYELVRNMVETLLAKAAQFSGDYTNRVVSTLLHRLDYNSVADIIDFNVDSDIRQQLDMLYKLNGNEEIETPNLSLLPTSRIIPELNQNPVFSIVLPVYNVAKYLHRSMASVIRQTESEIEIICVNDGSTDNSLDILEQYSQIDKRVRIINQENKGAFVARKVGAMAAKGQYLIFVDPDDWIEHDTCEVLEDVMDSAKPDIVEFATYIDSPSNSLDEKYIEGMQTFFNKHENIVQSGNTALISACFIESKILWHYWGKTIRTDVAKKAFAKMPDIHCNFAEDQIAMFYILSFASNLTNIRDRKYHYRLGTGISTMQKETLNDFDVKLNCFVLFEYLVKFVEGVYPNSCKEVNDSLKFIEQSMMENMWHRLLDNATDGDIYDWVKLWCEKAGTDRVISFIVDMTMLHDILKTEEHSEETPSIEAFRNNQNHYQRKYKKHLKAIRQLITLSIILLITNLITILICIFK